MDEKYLKANILSVKDYIRMQEKLLHSIYLWFSVRSLIVDGKGNTLSMLIYSIDDSFDFNYPPSLENLKRLNL